MMRITALAVFTGLAMGAMSAAAPVRAQAYDPAYPVCLQVFGPFNYNECRFTSLAQCAPAASGRGAQCIVNPYFVNAAQEPPPVRRHRRHRHAN
jgi:hypothetical protein